VLAVSDRATVLRDGITVGTKATKDVSREVLVNMMVGREIREPEIREHKQGDTVLQIRGLKALGDRGNAVLKGIDLEVKAGEILGIAGVSGNGQRELAECLAGMRVVSEGIIQVGASDLTHKDIIARIDQGLSFIPEERMRDGAIGDFTVCENVFLRDHTDEKYTKGIFLRKNAMDIHAQKLIDEFSVKTPSLETPIKNLSGGNIQKLIIARELARAPKVLIAAQPTRGVDIGASEYIHQTLVKQRDQGTAILLISEDLDEIRTLSDRIAVIFGGSIVGEVHRSDADIKKIGSLMASGLINETSSAISG
jgi:ABC-type uncharacterized transport system ATPase subunit